jgi:hypothetical protein
MTVRTFSNATAQHPLRLAVCCAALVGLCSCEAPELPSSGAAKSAPSERHQATASDDAESPTDPASGDAALTSVDILERVRAKYSGSATYRDKGEHTQTSTNADGKVDAERAELAIYYQRDSGDFRFDFNNKLPDATYECSVRRQAAHIEMTDRGYGRPPQTEHRDSLLSALHVFNGATNGTALLIPCLLAPNEVNQSAFWGGGVIRDVARVEDAPSGGQPCYVLKGTYYGQGTVEFWIDRSFAILAIRTDEAGAKGSLERTWQFRPEFDAALDSQVFAPASEEP